MKGFGLRLRVPRGGGVMGKDLVPYREPRIPDRNPGGTESQATAGVWALPRKVLLLRPPIRPPVRPPVRRRLVTACLLRPRCFWKGSNLPA